MADSLRHAHDAFYRALEANLAGDSAAMAAIWSEGSDITNLGPFGGILVGHDPVLNQFRAEAARGMGGRVVVDDLHLVEAGDMGYSIGTEIGEGITDGEGTPVDVRHRVTNIFRRDVTGWRLVHHHTDLGH